jgi:hypothetical protein
MSSNAPQIEIAEPKLYKTGAIIVVSAYGMVGIIPVFVLFLVVSLTGYRISTLLIALGVIALVAWLLPLASGNTYVTKLVRSLNPAAGSASDSFIVQLTLSPRIRYDIRALIEDADDIGYLKVSGTGFSFHGDSVKLTVPFDQIKQVQRKYRGLRSLFVPRVLVVVPGLPNVKSLEFSERSSRLLPGSIRTSKRLYDLLAQGASAARPTAL